MRFSFVRAYVWSHQVEVRMTVENYNGVNISAFHSLSTSCGKKLRSIDAQKLRVYAEEMWMAPFYV